jgi:hypothetical protein
MKYDFNVTDSNWEKIGPYKFRNKPLVQYPKDGLLTNVGTIIGSPKIRNAEVDFQIKIIKKTSSLHAAILFRKNGDYYLGAGLGGWSSKFSLMARNTGRINGFQIGNEQSININTIYNFKLKFESGFITKFSCNGEDQVLDNISINDSLNSVLTSGNFGLYAWDQTEAEISLSIKELPNIGFLISNMHPSKGTRKDTFQQILNDNNIKCKLIDARNLTNERPLMSKIKEGIIRADFVISDFGYELPPRPNVFYETGISHSLGTPTIHIGPTSEKFADMISSDLRAQFFILENDLEKNLPATVKSILESNSGIYKYID